MSECNPIVLLRVGDELIERRFALTVDALLVAHRILHADASGACPPSDRVSFSWNRDPATGVICVQSGPRCDGSRMVSDSVGGLDWDAGCGYDRQDTPSVFFAEENDQGDLPRVGDFSKGRAEGYPHGGDRVSLRADAAADASAVAVARTARWLLKANAPKAARERLTLVRIFEELQGLGFGGSYAAVWRYALRWGEEHASATAPAYIPLSFAPGEAYQFDWSHEIVVVNGATVTVTVKVAHARLCHSRLSHYFHTDKADGPVDRKLPTQVGRALERLGVEHIAAYSPQARGRSERLFQTLQDRLVKEPALAGIETVEAANAFLAQVYIPAHNARFAIGPEQPGTGFVAIPGVDLDEVLCVQEERLVGNDNCVSYNRLRLQILESPRSHEGVAAAGRVS